MITVEEMQQHLIRKTSEPRTGIFNYTFRDKEDFEWIYPYCKQVDGILTLNSGDLPLINKFQKFNNSISYDAAWSEVIEDVAFYLQIVIQSHEYELEKLIATLNLEYNPIYNVEEHTTEIYSGDGTSKNDTNVNHTDTNGGNESTKTEYGTLTENTNTTINAHTDTTSGNTNDNYGKTAGQYTTSGNVAPFDSDVFHSNTQDVNNHNEDARTDSHTTNNNINYGEQSQKDTTTTNAHTDTVTHTVDFTNTKNGTTNQNGVTTTSYAKTIERVGNIGVMSSQNMIQQERDIARFSIVQEICNIFIINFCQGWGVEQ